MKKINVLVSWSGDNYGAVASGDELGGCVVVTDSSLDKLKERFQEALDAHVNGFVSDGDDVPVALRGDYALNFELTTQALLRSVEDKITLTAIYKATGINAKQLSHYTTGERNPRPAQRKRIVQGIHHIAAELAAVV